jgi:tRNA-splicing ligase RtcB (3'-phosphate/5'-hydroxy nucleic acid ligase)
VLARRRRRHSRTQAKKLFTTADLAQQMQGKVCLATRATALVDEIPAAYKDIDQVIADQSDLVPRRARPVHARWIH